MKSLFKTIICFTMITFVLGCQNTKQQEETLVPETDKDKTSYAIGVNMATSIAELGDEIDLSMLKQGLEDKFHEKDLQVTNEEVQPLMKALSETLRNKQQEEYNKMAQKSLEAGKAFLEENKTKEGIITTESGLQYKVLKEGQGKTPGKTDNVKVHYRGTTLDGTEFDSSYSRGKPATFRADQVISGWTEGLQLMKEGGKYQLFLPGDLAYGQSGAGQKIGPNETLIFEIELLEVIEELASETQSPE